MDRLYAGFAVTGNGREVGFTHIAALIEADSAKIERATRKIRKLLSNLERGVVFDPGGKKSRYGSCATAATSTSAKQLLRSVPVCSHPPKRLSSSGRHEPIKPVPGTCTRTILNFCFTGRRREPADRLWLSIYRFWLAQ
jgi:hypothetical protein